MSPSLPVPCVCVLSAGEASEWRETATAAAPTSSNASKTLRVVGTVAIVAALAVTTLVFLSGDETTAALAAKVAGVAPAAVAVAAPKVAHVLAAPKVALAAPAHVPAAPRAAPTAMKMAAAPVRAAGKGTTKMSDNWRINQNLPESPTYSDLEREVSELEKEEKQHFDTRAASMNTAMNSAANEGNTAGLKGLKWKNAKDKYEQAAYKDIMDEEKERIADSITDEGAQMFQQYEKKAQSLMGTDELKALQNSTERAEHERSMREKSALTALRSANAALKKVEQAQDAERDAEDMKKQERANAKMAAHLESAVARESGSAQYYKKVAAAQAYDNERSVQEKESISHYKNDHQALKDRNPEALHPEHADTPYHKDYLAAQTIEDQRNAAFAKEIQTVRWARERGSARETERL